MTAPPQTPPARLRAAAQAAQDIEQARALVARAALALSAFAPFYVAPRGRLREAADGLGGKVRMNVEECEIDDACSCPACGNHVTHSRHCSNFHCDDGWEDEYDDDPINYAPGESLLMCEECSGTGIERWCPKCGADYWRAKAAKRKARGGGSGVGK